MRFKSLMKSKTVWVAIIAILVAITSFAIGELTLVELIMATVGGFTVIFIRDGLEKKIRARFEKWKFWRSKTFWASIAEMLALSTAFVNGSISITAYVTGLFAALIAISMRNAVNKVVLK